MSRSSLPIAAVVAIGLGFGSVAVWTGNGILTACYEAWAMRNSEAVPARLIYIDRRFEEVGSRLVEKMTVRYRYEYGGIPYEKETEQLSLFARDFYMFDGVEKAFRDKTPVKCHVDPDYPSRTYLSLEFSIPLFLLCLLFPIFFGLVALIMVRDLIHRRRQKLRKTEN